MNEVIFQLGWVSGLVCVFLSVLALCWSARHLWRGISATLAESEAATPSPASEFLIIERAPETKGLSSRLGSLATPSDDAERGTLRLKLIQAGYRGPQNLEHFATLRTVLALVLSVMLGLFGPADGTLGLLFFVLLGATMGYYMPSLVVYQKGQSRRGAVLRPLPDTLDLLVSSIEAGLGLDSALQRVAEEMAPTAPILAAELRLVNDEIAVGVHRIDALHRLNERNGVDELGSLVNVLVQAERYGTSIAQALRAHADLVRRKRMLAAEEHAAKISPKLTVMMIVFILPSLFTILIGPTIVNVIEHLLPSLASGMK